MEKVPQKQPFTGKCQVTSIILGGRRRLNYNFEDKSEIVEEFDTKSHELVSRKLKKPSNIKETGWVYEIGEAPSKSPEEEVLIKSNQNPSFLRKDTARDFQFRVRNLPYPEDVYSTEVDEVKQQIVIRTSNKKYYKRFEIQDMVRQNIKIDPKRITWVYKNNTLVISYPKPDTILTHESKIRTEFDKLNAKNPKEGDIECVTQ